MVLLEPSQTMGIGGNYYGLIVVDDTIIIHGLYS